MIDREKRKIYHRAGHKRINIMLLKYISTIYNHDLTICYSDNIT